MIPSWLSLPSRLPWFNQDSPHREGSRQKPKDWRKKAKRRRRIAQASRAHNRKFH